MSSGIDIRLTSTLESSAYVDMTIDAMAHFGVCVTRTDSGFYVPGSLEYRSPGRARIDGDWSNSAFWLTAGALNGRVGCSGLSFGYAQGDRAIVDILRGLGARVSSTGTDLVRVSSGQLRAIDIDASSIPDLVPVLAVAATVARGTTRIYNASRLRLKESDRLRTTASLLTALGADVTATDDGFLIRGKPQLEGGTVSSAGDHRIAMAAAVAACRCRTPVTVIGAECVAKSYPDFWTDYRKLGGIAHVI